MQCSLSESGPEFTDYQVTLESVVSVVLKIRGTIEDLQPERRLKTKKNKKTTTLNGNRPASQGA